MAYMYVGCSYLLPLVVRDFCRVAFLDGYQGALWQPWVHCCGGGRYVEGNAAHMHHSFQPVNAHPFTQRAHEVLLCLHTSCHQSCRGVAGMVRARCSGASPMLGCIDCQGVCANLVGCVPICCNPVSPYNHCINLALRHQRCSCRVHYERGSQPIMHQLIRSQPGSCTPLRLLASCQRVKLCCRRAQGCSTGVGGPP